MKGLQVGAQLYSIRDHCQNAEDMLAALKQIKAIGYNVCQLSGHNRDITAAQLRAMLDEVELFCACTHISYDEMVEDLDKVVEYHKTIGCAYPGIGGLPPRFRNAEGYVAFAKEAGAIADKLRDHGMTFIYHNHNFEFERFAEHGKKTGLELIMENSSDALQFELDMFWVQAAGASPLEMIERVRGRMDIAHFKDMGFGPDMGKFHMTPVGEGNINFKAIIDACNDIGVKYALVEQDNAVESDSIACMRQSFENLTAISARF